MDDDYYKLLELPPTASEDSIREAITTQQRKWSKRASNAPNLEDRQDAERKVAQIAAARRVLLDPTQRQNYDRARSGQPWPNPGPAPEIRLSPPLPSPQPPQSGPGPRLVSSSVMPKFWARKRIRWTIIVVIVLIGISAATSGNNKQGAASLPSGATPEAVMRPIVSGLRSCARSAVLQPANCPQQASSSSGTAVSWTLHGDATAGAQISANGNQITVDGHTVMSVSYDADGTPTYEVDTISYEATLHWTGRRAVLTGMSQLQQEPNTPITQRRPAVSDSAVQNAVKAAFVRCAAASGPNVPNHCPSAMGIYISYTNTSYTNVHRSLVADPLLNSRVTYDNSYGILHVVGSYSAKVTYDEDGSPNTDTPQGSYDALVTDDGGRLSVVQIKTS